MVLNQEREVAEVAKFARVDIHEAWSMPYLIFLQQLRQARAKEERDNDLLMSGYDFLAQQVVSLAFGSDKHKTYSEFKQERANEIAIQKLGKDLVGDAEKASFASVLMAFDNQVNEKLIEASNEAVNEKLIEASNEAVKA